MPMVMMLDDCGLPRAWGAAKSEADARTEAHRQLALYVVKKRALGEPLRIEDFTEQVAPLPPSGRST